MPDIPYPVNFFPKKKDARVTPVACILKTYESLCRRTIDQDKEFVFKDAIWAIEYYDRPNSPIRVCSACKDIYLKPNR